MTISESLRAISLYPINPLTAENIADECGLYGDDTISPEVRNTKAYKKAKAKVYLYLAEAPAVSQAGATYSFTDAEREAFRRKAAQLLEEIDEASEGGIVCGYLSEDF